MCHNYPKLKWSEFVCNNLWWLKRQFVFVLSFDIICNVLHLHYRNKTMERKPEPNHTVGWRTEWQVGCCCVAWNFIRKRQTANALMFLSVFKGCLECHQSSRQKWKHWKNTPNRHFKVEERRTERTTDELKRIFSKTLLFVDWTQYKLIVFTQWR